MNDAQDLKDSRMNKLIVVLTLLALVGCAGSPMRLETRGDTSASSDAALQEGARRAMATRSHDGRSE
jgi:hypothetical protein